MKAALEAWGADSNLFHQGAAKESHDPDVIAATMAKPGVVLKRPVGSDGPFGEHAELPTYLSNGASRPKPKKSGKPKKSPPRAMEAAAERNANLAFEKEQARRESKRSKEEATRAKEQKRRQHAIDKAQEALNRAERIHEEKTASINDERDRIEKRMQAEDNRWAQEKEKLDRVLRRARDP
jgi:hypothetical protein